MTESVRKGRMAMVQETRDRLFGPPALSKINSEAKAKESEVQPSFTNRALVIHPVSKWLSHAAEKPEPRRFFGDFLFEGEVCILFAETNVGKSLLAVQIADGISSGRSVFPDFPVGSDGESVLLLDFELSDRQFQKRYSDDGGQPYCFGQGFFRAEINSDFEFVGDWEDAIKEAIETAITETEARVVIVDNITYLKDETDKAKAALPLMRYLNTLKKRHGLSMLVLAHTPKRDSSRPMDRNDLAGSRNLLNLADSCFALGESHRDEGMRYLKQIKARQTELKYTADNVVLLSLNKDGAFLGFNFMGYGSEMEHLRRMNTGDRTQLQSSILSLKERHPGMSSREIADEVGTSHTTVIRTLASAKQTGTLGTPISSVPDVPSIPIGSTGNGLSATSPPMSAGVTPPSDLTDTATHTPSCNEL